jgi:hypothetical protein
VEIDRALVARLIGSQFPRWSSLPITAAEPNGWDNRTFRLGPDLLVRLPRAQSYAAQIPKEQRWLPVLAPQLPLPIPVPVAIGEPGEGYPWHWSIYRWLYGVPASTAVIDDLTEFAQTLANFWSACSGLMRRAGHRRAHTTSSAAGRWKPTTPTRDYRCRPLMGRPSPTVTGAPGDGKHARSALRKLRTA